MFIVNSIMKTVKKVCITNTKKNKTMDKKRIPILVTVFYVFMIKNTKIKIITVMTILKHKFKYQ